MNPTQISLPDHAARGRLQGLPVRGEAVPLSNSLRIGFDCDAMQRLVHQILGECLEETQVKSHTTRTDALSCMISSGITETAGLLLGEERRHGRQRTLTVVDFVSGEENGGLALRTKCNVALTYELMQMCISEYIPRKFPSRSVEIVGWYHSHPREVTLDDMSSVDKETQKAYQALYKSAVCLIVKMDLLSRAWLKALTRSYVLMDEIRKALCFYQISGRNKVVPIEWGFQRDGIELSLKTHVYPSWFTPPQKINRRRTK